MADGPVFEMRTVRDFAEKSVTASFWSDFLVLLVLDFKPPIHPPLVGVLDPTQFRVSL